MARLYPNRDTWEPGRGAERAVYEACQAQLDDTYIVFYSVKWLALDNQRRPRDCEADFIIAHPQRGILVLEVKGGNINFDPTAGRWTSTDRGGYIHVIKDPFEQATNNKYDLLHQLKEMVADPRRRFNIGHAVAFPDVVLGPFGLGPDRPRVLILDATDLADLSGWAGRALAYWRGADTQAATAPAAEGVTALQTLLVQERDLRPAMWGEFVQEQKQLIRLTEQQYGLLNMLTYHRRAAISGCAGSGKTMVAVEKAQRLARQGFRVLLTCYNKNLAFDLRDRLNPPANLDITNFHDLCGSLAQQAGVAPPFSDSRSYYDNELPEALMRAVEKLDVRYDAIVVDEGQDFQEHWWIPLQMLLTDPDHGILYIFFDDNQRIYVKHSAFPIDSAPYTLSVNCRNTQRIHRQVVKFYQADSVPTVNGPPGREPEIIRFSESEGLQATLARVLQRFTVEERVPTDEIEVLTPFGQKKSGLWRTPLPGRLSLSDTWPIEPNQVHWCTIHSFKGLERAVVILAEVERWPIIPDLPGLLYVACSRARSHLVVLLPEHTKLHIDALFSSK